MWLQNEVGDVEDSIHSEPERLPEWFGYKFVGDNIDKNVKPSHQRYELKGLSLHHFHGFAVRDWVNFSGMSEESPTFTNPDPSQFLPSESDVSLLKEEFVILISRYIMLIIVSMHIVMLFDSVFYA